MEDNGFSPVPFLTREMLKFGRSAKLELRITSIADGAIVVLTRGITRAGIISFPHTSSADSTRSSTIIRIDDIPALVSIVPIATSLTHGRLWVELDLLVNGDNVFPMVSGLLSSAKGLSWPNSSMIDTIPGRGAFVRVNTANPAAGAQIAFTTVANETFRLLYASVTLVTDANAANRRLHLVITDVTGPEVDIIASVDQAASLTRVYSFIQNPGALDEADDDNITVPLPKDLWIRGESTIATTLTNGQTGDNLGILSMLVEKFYDGG